MGKKVYAIKEGFDSINKKKIENTIVNTWAECLKYVKGVKGAKYKSFENIDDAKNFLSNSKDILKKEDDNYPKDCLHIYVDGSYSISSGEYSYGMVAVKDNIVLHIESGVGKSSSSKNIRQIAGELQGAIKGVEYAKKNGEKKVVIFHDYAGICYHATGFWERKEESSKRYYETMNELIKSGIEVIFVKVDSHTGDLFNELVDEKCKEKLFINSDKVVERWLRQNTIKVANNKVKEEILKIAPTGEENINVLDLKVNTNTKVNKFDDIIKNYKKDSILTKSIISNLNDEEKINFIVYLLEN